MFEKQVQALATIWKDTDIKAWTGDGVANLIKCVVLEDPEAGIATADDIKKIIVHTPTILYWDKMNRFMNGVFVDGETRVKLAEKFENDNPKYILFVKKQMHMINEFSDDAIIDYYAQLTRCYLYTDLEDGLYLKLAKFLSMCTPTELEFLENASLDARFENSMMVSSGIGSHGTPSKAFPYFVQMSAGLLLRGSTSTYSFPSHSYTGRSQLSRPNKRSVSFGAARNSS